MLKSINTTMKLAYRGYIYEADYHNKPTSHFNLEFIAKIHDLAEKVGIALHRLIRRKDFQMDVPYKVITSPSIYLVVMEETQIAGADAVMGDYEDGYIIQVPVRNVANRTVDKDMFIHLLHEVTHILQREEGITSPFSNLYSGFDVNDNVYFNDPTEIHAFLMSVISYITYSAQRARILGKLPFDQFVRTILGYLKAPKSFIEYMANGKKSESKFDDGDNTHDSTRSQFFEVLHYLQAKLKQGYFTSLPAMNYEE